MLYLRSSQFKVGHQWVTGVCMAAGGPRLFNPVRSTLLGHRRASVRAGVTLGQDCCLLGVV
jgi:hypothetical protein